MALSTYSELQASIANWLERADLGTFIPEFITLFEAKVNRTLRVAQMETQATGTSTNGILALPSDFLAPRRVIAANGALEPVTPEWAAERYPTNAGGSPNFYTIKGFTLSTYPAYSGEVTLDYYAALSALSDGLASNWLLASHPDAYLFGSLVEAGAFVSDPVKAAFFEQRKAAVFDEIRSQDTARRYSNISARVKGPTP